MMQIVKRDGRLEAVHFDKITSRLQKLCRVTPALGIDVARVAQHVCAAIHDGISTVTLDEVSADAAIALATDHPDYATLAARILVSNLHKTTHADVRDVYSRITHVVSAEFWDIMCTHAEELNAMLDFTRDYAFDFFGFKTLQKAYLLDGERPQHMYVRVAVGIWGTDFANVRATYEGLSKHMFTHASPTLFNAGTKTPQLASCFLCGVHDDSLDCIFETFHKTAKISKYGGGIGMHVHSIRSKGSIIKSTNGTSDGLVPMLKVANEVFKYVNQCFVPETPVYTARGVVRIDTITPGDTVLTKDGTFRSVLEVFVRDAVEEAGVTLVPTHGFMPVTCTAVHDVWAIQGPDFLKGRFVPAGELQAGDLVGFPIPVVDDGIPENDDLSEDACAVYGMILGAGDIDESSGDVIVTFDMTIPDVHEAMKTLAGVADPDELTEFRNDRYRDIVWEAKGRMVRDMVFDDDGERRLHPWLLRMDTHRTAALLLGYLRTCSWGTQVFVGTGPLAASLRYLFLRTGRLISAASSSFTAKYHLDIATLECDMVHDNVVYTPLARVEPTTLSGPVYDLCVDGNENYTTDAGLVHNSGKRKGSCAIYLEPHHADIMNVLDLKRNQGDEHLRARDLFYALWISDLFMKRVESNGMWSVFDPATAPGLEDVWGDAYVALYERYEAEGRAVKTLPAQDVWFAALRSQIETGVPYMCYKDAANGKSNQQNLGTIKCSNLCVAPETLVLTSEGYREIQDLCDTQVEVWNGEQWSTVTVRKTQEAADLITITLSSGVSLECTRYHKFYMRDGTCVRAEDLQSGMQLLEWTPPIADLRGVMLWLSGIVDAAGSFKHGGISLSLPTPLLDEIRLTLLTMGMFSEFSDGELFMSSHTVARLVQHGLSTKTFDISGVFRAIEPITVASVRFTGRVDDTYCFDEPIRHMGVFNGILTGNCSEIMEYTAPDEVAVCNLASLSLPAFVNAETTTYDYAALHRTVKIVARNLDRVRGT
jgi:ribonucleoside-diphosphate reductase alpha chain